jgi:hypothetical protein
MWTPAIEASIKSARALSVDTMGHIDPTPQNALPGPESRQTFTRKQSEMMESACICVPNHQLLRQLTTTHDSQHTYTTLETTNGPPLLGGTWIYEIYENPNVP